MQQIKIVRIVDSLAEVEAGNDDNEGDDNDMQ
jgi:hypothetical protein